MMATEDARPHWRRVVAIAAAATVLSGLTWSGLLFSYGYLVEDHCGEVSTGVMILAWVALVVSGLLLLSVTLLVAHMLRINNLSSRITTALPLLPLFLLAAWILYSVNSATLGCGE